MSGDRPKVFISRLIPDEGIDPIVAACDARVWEGDLPPPRAELLAAVAGCAGIVTLLTDRVDDELLDAAGPQLRVVVELRRRVRQRRRPGVHARAASPSATRRAS